MTQQDSIQRTSGDQAGPDVVINVWRGNKEDKKNTYSFLQYIYHRIFNRTAFNHYQQQLIILTFLYCTDLY